MTSASRTLRESLSYEPQELAFGTSGLRGLVADLSQLEVAISTSGFLRYLLETGQVKRGDAVCLAGDLRPSTAGPVDLAGMPRGRLLQAVHYAVREAGLRPIYLGLIPTPALMHYALGRGLAGVMVTGSHIPFDRNGIKFNKPSGEVLKADEAEILTRIRQVRGELGDAPASGSAFGSDGMLKADRLPDLSAPDDAARSEYLERYTRAFPKDALRNCRVLVYQHSAVGRDLLVELLRRLGADVRAAGGSEVFIPIDTEAVDARLLETIQRLVDAHGGAALDAVVSTDGDSDRPLLLGVDSGRVRFFGGDLIGIVVADYLGCRHVAVPVSASEAVNLHFDPRGVEVVRTRIGSPHVIAAMRETGWEANGGFLTACTCRIPGGGTLSPLPTRDAFLPLLAALHASLGRGVSLSECFGRLPQRFGVSDLLRDFPREAGQAILQRFQPRDESIEHVEFTYDGASARQRGRTAAALASVELTQDLNRCREAWEQLFRPGEGYAKVVWMNFLDGVRVGLADGGVVQVRPSGNAPDFRVYATASSMARAVELARQTLQIFGELRRGVPTQSKPSRPTVGGMRHAGG